MKSSAFTLVAAFSLVVGSAGPDALAQNTVELARIGAWPGYQRNLIWRLQVSQSTVFAADGEGLVVFDVSDPENPQLVTRHALPGAPSEFQYREGYVYVAMGSDGLAIVDVQSPDAPRTVSVHAVEGGARDLEVNGNVVFVQTGEGSTFDEGTLEAIDVQDRSNPTTLSRFGAGIAPGLSAEGGYLCAARWGGVEFFDVTDPREPRSLTVFTTPGYASDVVLSGGFAYVADDWMGLTVLDVHDPTNPTLVANVGTGYANQVEVSGEHAFVYTSGNNDSMVVYDISVPTAPAQVAVLGEVLRPLTVSGNLGFSAYWGLRIYDMTDPAQTTRIGVYPLGCDPQQIAVTGQTALVANGYLGLAILDISDPAEPRELANYLMAPGEEYVHGVSVSGHYAYLSKWYVDGVEVVDVSDPAHPASVTTLPLDPLGPMRLTSGRAYVPTTWDGLVVLDITDPGQPRELGRLGDLVVPGGSNTKLYHVLELAAVGDYVVAKGFEEWPVLVVDCSDGSNIQVMTNLVHPLIQPSTLDAQENKVVVAGRPGLVIYDLSDPAEPEAISRAGANDIYTAVDWDGDYLYLTGYLGTDTLTIGPPGIVVMDVTDPSNPERAGSISVESFNLTVTAADGLIFVGDSSVGVQIFRVAHLPRLRMERTEQGLRLSWNAEPGVILQMCPALAAGQWEDLAAGTGLGEIVVDNSGQSMFYRLIKSP